MPAASLEDSVDELLERLADIGIPSDDVTVEDVLHKAAPARFVRLGAHLASDVAAVVATGCVAVDDHAGVNSAMSAIYRSAANAANNPTAAAARLEHGLRRLAAAVNKDATDGSISDVLSSLVTYVQVGTMLVRRARDAGSIPAGGTETDATDATMDATETERVPSLDPARRARASRELWRLAEGLSADDGVARALTRRTFRHQKNPPNFVTGHDPEVPNAMEVLEASLGAVRSALRALPSDHLQRVFDESPLKTLSEEDALFLRAVNDSFSSEYATRKETVARRAWLTVQSFGQSPRLKDTPDLVARFSKSTGFGDDGDHATRTPATSEEEDSFRLPLDSIVAFADVCDARLADLARAQQRTNADSGRKLDASVKRVRIGAVPDRGGRTEFGGEGKSGAGDMPAFAERGVDGPGRGGGRNGGGGRGHREGRMPGRAGRGGRGMPRVGKNF
jgi:hypothetical protein